MTRKTENERWISQVTQDGECLVWVGRRDRQGYGRFWSTSAKRRVMAHRFAYELSKGHIPDGMQVDHVCHNTSCVFVDHLRLATPSQNKENMAGARIDSKSGIRGVRWAKRQRKWYASVRQMGTLHYLGYFDDIRDAEAAVIAKRNELFTHNDADRKAA